MMWKDVIQLVSSEAGPEDRDDIGEIIDKEPIKTTVFADRKSVRGAEFYQAAANGLKPEAMFVIRSAEYNGELLLEYEGKQYKVIRTYEVGNDLMELTCERDVHG